MSRLIQTNYDFNKHEIQNAVIQVLVADPPLPSLAQIYFNSALDRLKFNSSTGWIDPTNRLTHSGTQLAATISDFDVAVSLIRLDQMSIPTTPLNLNGQRLSNLGDGVNATDAATYGQLLTVLNGRDFKDSVRVATTTSVVQSGLDPIDDVVLVDGDRVLDKDNVSAELRGFWVVHAGAWTRPTDFDSTAKVTSRLSTLIEEGTINAGAHYTLTTIGPIVLESTPLTFAKTGTGSVYTPGPGIVIVGNSIGIDTSVVVLRHTAPFGDGVSLDFTITHNLGTKSVFISVFETNTGAEVECDKLRSTINTVTLSGFLVPPTVEQYTVVIG